MYLLGCDVPIVNNTCETGFKSVAQVVEPTLMTLGQFEQLTPYVLTFFVACSVYRKLSN